MTLGAFREKALEKEKEKNKGLTSDELLLQLEKTETTKNSARTIAILQELNKRGDLSKAGLNRVLTDQNKASFASYGKNKNFNAIEKSVGINVATWQAIRSGNAKESEKEFRKFFDDLSNTDITKINFNDIYAKDSYGLDEKQSTILHSAFTSALARNNPGNLKHPLIKVKAKNYSNMTDAIEKLITSLPKEASKTPVILGPSGQPIKKPELDEETKKLIELRTQIEKAFDKIKSRRSEGAIDARETETT